MKLFGKHLHSLTHAICVAVVSAASPGFARADIMDVDPTFLQLTQSIDIRTAIAVSVLSLIILAALRKADFMGKFGIWGGRFIIFVLVVLSIGLWATQV